MGMRNYLDAAELAKKKGMKSVISSDTRQGYWKFAADRHIGSKERLLSMNPMKFAEIMENWYEWWTEPMIRFANLSADELSSISAPTIVIPGDNPAHPRHVGRELFAMMSCSCLCDPVELQLAALAPIIAGFVGGLECQSLR